LIEKKKFGSLGCVIVKHKNTMKKLSHKCRQRSKVLHCQSTDLGLITMKK